MCSVKELLLLLFIVVLFFFKYVDYVLNYILLSMQSVYLFSNYHKHVTINLSLTDIGLQRQHRFLFLEIMCSY